MKANGNRYTGEKRNQIIELVKANEKTDYIIAEHKVR